MRSKVGLSLLLLVVAFPCPVPAKEKPIVLGYSASWFDGLYPPESYNYDGLTHIARSFLLPKADGTIGVQGGFFDPDLERLAHAHGVKLIASIGGAAANADNWLAMARDPKAERLFFDNLDKLITQNRYDGVDIDWEPSALTDADQATYTQFMKDLRGRFPQWLITTALGGGDYWAKHISWKEVAAQVDWINWMTYDFAGSWTGHSAHNANLYDSVPVRTEMSVDRERDHLENRFGAPAEKLVLGLPFYGTQFFTARMGEDFTGDASRQGSEIQFYEIAGLLTPGSGYTKKWDKDAQVPYLEKEGGEHTISYDDPKSLALKCRYAMDQGLRGVMIWNIGADIVGENTPLLDAVDKAMGLPSRSMPPSGLEKTFANFASTLKDTYSKLQGTQAKLQAAGKLEEAKAADPGPLPDLALPTNSDSKVLGKGIWAVQYRLTVLGRKLQAAQAVASALPVKEVAGQKLNASGNRVLIGDFESGTNGTAFQGVWMTDMDHNNLGTVLNPVPFTPSPGGSPASPKFAAHLWGHFGKSQAPWPYAMLTGTLDPSGTAVDLSAFRGVEFQTKGDGKTYSIILARAAVEDYCNFKQDFKAGKDWMKISLNLSDFKQPSWGRAIPLKLSDVLYFAFSPNADFSDEDMDLWMDDLALLK
ncbi:MAG TPA: CIA30 family protein [bacterium]|nr:CIA30 family protein [bacterium]